MTLSEQQTSSYRDEHDHLRSLVDTLDKVTRGDTKYIPTPAEYDMIKDINDKLTDVLYLANQWRKSRDEL